MAWAVSAKPKLRTLRNLVHRYSESRGALRWQFGGPTPRLSPWGVSTCKDLLHSRDVDIIAAYFAPTWGLLITGIVAGTAAFLLSRGKWRHG